jgi:para-aminobenzoate synthetase/4-amino-4-deoxychorismate lyase
MAVHSSVRLDTHSLVRCRIDHSAAGQPALELRNFRGQLEARALSDVITMLGDVEAAVRRGWFAAGFVTYEAAPAFDPALGVRAPSSQPLDASTIPLAWFGLFSEASPAAPLPPAHARPSAENRHGSQWDCDVDQNVHADGVAHIRAEIASGNTYLVNLTTRFRRSWAPADDPFELYCQLVGSDTSGYHAYLETPDWAVACASPELFFEWHAHDIVTRPMKGTAPRGRWSGEDEAQAQALSGSPKERAENIMVVDMLRNDLGRIAVPGSVAVPSLCHLEHHPTLWQMSSTVRATTPETVGLPDIFRALFPCASVTGAPKVAAMSVIADLEASPRGVYCGAVGLVCPAGPGVPTPPSARFAVGIRTAVVDRALQAASYGSGGGVTWDSTAPREWEEVLLKARALVAPWSLRSEVDGLIETMAFDPAAGPGGAIRHLSDHVARLSSSAQYFGFCLPSEGVAELLDDAIAGLRTPARVRLVLRAGGAMDVQTSLLDQQAPTSVLLLCVDPEPVDSSEVTLFHKTTDRARYDDRARRHPNADDVVLVNERGEITETTRANVAVRLGAQWYTPPLRCGLLPGIKRAKDLAEGRLLERVITVDELLSAQSVATLSSLRGWRAARVADTCRCGDAPTGSPFPESDMAAAAAARAREPLVRP